MKEKKDYTLTDSEFDAEMQKNFKGTGPKCEAEQAKDCYFYGKHKDGGCDVLDRKNCLGCTFHTTEEVPAYAKYIREKELEKQREQLKS